MEGNRGALWRIEFQSDLTRANSVIIPIGFLMESEWEKARWLGMIYRKSLTQLELDEVNSQTWPELGQMEPFMKGLFDSAWNSERTSECVRSAAVAAMYSHVSALRFVHEAFSPSTGPEILLRRLRALRPRLVPALTAPVVELPKRKKPKAPTIEPNVAVLNLLTDKAAA